MLESNFNRVKNFGVSENKRMSKLFWNTLKISPILLAATVVVSSRAQAAPVNSAPVGETSVSQLSEPAPANTMAQVTSVSQLSDVQPTDWAFQALQSLVERYGCIAGYPDGTFRGNRALTRYEFAAGLNACLDRVNELIATGGADGVRKEDLATLQRLQEEFSAEVATLRGRVDSLEARTAELEANQFSTTTKLTGEVIAAVSDVFADRIAVPSSPAAPGQPTPNADNAPDENVNTVLADRARLNFDTSFTGKDLLRTRLQARNVTPFGTTRTGTNMTRLAFDGDEGNDVLLDDFFYRFPLGDIAEVKVDFDNVEFNDNVYTFNPAFESSGRGAISRFGRFNPIYRQGTGGAGLTVNLNPKGKIGLSLAYLAQNAENPNQNFGLFNGDYTALAQLAFRPNDNINLGLTYAHTYDNTIDPDLTVAGNPNAVNVLGGVGSTYANSPFGNVATSANHYGVQGSFKLGEKLTISGWGGLTYALAEDGTGVANVTTGDSAEIWNWAATLALQDFGKEGSVLGLIFGQPPRAGSNDFATGTVRQDRDTTYHLEALYRFPITDNIEITPGVIVLFNPEHNENNDNIYVGTLRTTFRF